MIELKLQRPYIKDNLERHYAEDENGVKYKIKQNETGYIYDEAVDLTPCRYTYSITNEPVEQEVLNEQ